MTSRRLGIDDATTTVNTTVTETELTSLTVPAYGLAADGIVRFTCAGDFLNNTGGADTILFKVKLGASVALTTPATSLGTSANRRKWRMVVEILAESDSVQRLSAELFISAAGTEDFAASGDYLIGYGTDAEDGTSPIDVSVTATLGTSSVSLEITCKLALLEALR